MNKTFKRQRTTKKENNRRLYRLLAACMSIALLCGVFAISASAEFHDTSNRLYPTEGTYRIQNVYSGKDLDIVRSVSTGSNGDPAVQYHRVSGNVSQFWKFVNLGSGWHRIVPLVNDGKTLNVHNSPVANTANFATVNIWDYVGADSQKWKMSMVESEQSTSYVFQSKSGGNSPAKYLEVSDYTTADFAQVKQCQFNTSGSNNANQCWIVADMEGNPIPLLYKHLVDSGHHLDMSMNSSTTAYESTIAAAATTWNNWAIANGFGQIIRWHDSSNLNDVTFTTFSNSSINAPTAETMNEFMNGQIKINTAKFDPLSLAERKNVLTHELGHALGLDHQNNSGHIMYGASSTRTALSDADKAAFRHAIFKYDY